MLNNGVAEIIADFQLQTFDRKITDFGDFSTAIIMHLEQQFSHALSTLKQQTFEKKELSLVILQGMEKFKKILNDCKNQKKVFLFWFWLERLDKLIFLFGKQN